MNILNSKYIRYAACFLLIFGLSVFSSCAKKPGQNRIDLSKYPFYVEDYEEMAYNFGLNETITPYFKGNVIYNESVMLTGYGTEISGNLNYNAIKVISVRDYTLKKVFTEGVDYTVNGKKITVTKDSQIPYLTENNIKGKDIPGPYRQVTSISNIETDYMLVAANVIYTEGSLIYGHQVFVTYVYDVNELNTADFNFYNENKLLKTRAKLTGGNPLKMAIIGDSVGKGCSSSKFFNREPYMDNFITLAKQGLEQKYGASVNLNNFSLGGTKSAWGQDSTQVNKIISAAPDLLFIHFGINDCGDGISANMFADNIESLVLQVNNALPDIEIVIFNAFTPNPLAYDSSRLENYWAKNRAISERNENVSIIDMYSLSLKMLQSKKYMDVTGNGINHLNDYSARLYTMAILSALINY